MFSKRQAGVRPLLNLRVYRQALFNANRAFVCANRAQENHFSCANK